MHVAKAVAGEVQDDKQQDQDEGNNPKQLHRARCTGVGIARRISHASPHLLHGVVKVFKAEAAVYQDSVYLSPLAAIL
jgi:hypothetical protein